MTWAQLRSLLEATKGMDFSKPPEPLDDETQHLVDVMVERAKEIEAELKACSYRQSGE